MPTETKSRNVHQRKLAVMTKCDGIRPDRVHPHHKFEYVSIQATSNHLRRFCAEEGLDIVESITDGSLVLELVNADEPADRIVSTWPVIPEDKAWAYTIKWALIRLFLIGDGEEGDEAAGANMSGRVATAQAQPQAEQVRVAQQARGTVPTPPRRPDAQRIGPDSLPGRPRVADDDDIPPPMDADNPFQPALVR